MEGDVEYEPLKGGRGKKAPYETISIRIPEALRDKVDAMATAYKQAALCTPESLSRDLWEKHAITTAISAQADYPLFPPPGSSDQLSLSDPPLPALSYAEALEKAELIAKVDKTRKGPLLKLVSAIYGINT